MTYDEAIQVLISMIHAKREAPEVLQITQAILNLENAKARADPSR